MASDFETRIRNVTAVLGPTNTGKTHLAIERMLGHQSGMIGLPLRLLAREVYDKIKSRVGPENVALITGEEKIKPERARYWVSTVEAMPRDVDVDFLAIDEIQLCGDLERGHVFTDRLLHARGRSETLLLGAQTMRDAIADLIPGANFISRPRLSKLSYTGEKKITRLPTRTAIVAFSAADVYEIAELIRRQRGGAAVVIGALSPRTRNAQVALYQSGDVEFLVATDAIGMGLNLDVDHVAFSAMRKFDGQNYRNLTPAEVGQIAGRAGRHMNDGTFGVTGAGDAFDADLVERLEQHSFDPVRMLQWRSRRIDFATLDRLYDSLKEFPREQRLTRARTADDVAALEALMADREVAELARTPALVEKLWDACQIPDYRKISAQSHAELVTHIYKHVAVGNGHIPEDWFTKQVALADRTDGDIDTLATRIAHIRTWTFVANRPDWLNDPAHWQARTREIEDSLSDALHERLTQRFVDRRTSALMKGMRDKDELNAEIADDGSITVENHFVGRLKGFCFTPDASADGIHEKATRQAATHVLTRELSMRARRVAAAQNDAFRLTRNARIVWRDVEIAKLEAADDPLQPSVTLLVDEHLAISDREKVLERLKTWLKDQIADKLKPLVDMANATDLQGLSRGVAFRLKENFGVLKRETVADEIAALDQTARADLRKYGLRFGAFNIFFPVMLKPASADLAATLWLLKYGAELVGGETTLPRPGLTSASVCAATPDALYRANGFHLCGPRAVRLDILERLADLIRPLLAWRASPDKVETPPKGSTGDGGFKATDHMMSILGCSAAELGEVLKTLGFRIERRPVASSSGGDVAAEAAPSAADDTVDSSQTEPDAIVEPSSQAGTVDATASEPAPAEALSPAAEAAAAADASATTAAPPATAEAFEEIWRPRRHHRPDRRDRGKATEGGERRQGSDRHARFRRGAAKSDLPSASTDAATVTAGDATGVATPQPQPQQPERGSAHRGDRGKAGDHAQSRSDRRGGHRGDRGRSSGGHHRDKPRRDEGRRQPEVITAAPPKRAGVDPDSPFAALAVLKASMDKRGDGPGSP